jgi:hypothetical protein
VGTGEFIEGWLQEKLNGTVQDLRAQCRYHGTSSSTASTAPSRTR